MLSHIVSEIESCLTGEMQCAALEFVQYLEHAGLDFYRDRGACWKDKIYYWVTCREQCVCFIALRDPDEPENAWTVWSEDSPVYEADSVSDAVRTVGWNHVGYCGSCGSCGGGREKIIFGKAFPGVCGCTFRVDNAGCGELEFLKTMVSLRLQEIKENQ